MADAEKIAAWRAGENVVLGPSLYAPVEKRVYRLILGIMAKGEDWQTNGHTIPVDRITADGTLYAGCHTIKFDEITRFAAERGWTK